MKDFVGLFSVSKRLVACLLQFDTAVGWQPNNHFECAEE